MPKRIHKYLFYTLITIVYGVFFSVESFYNFEGHSDARNLLNHASLTRQEVGNRGVSTSPAQFPCTHSCRLNKRYQQENFPPCPIFRAQTPVCFVMPGRPATYPVCSLPSITIDHSPSRGPPIAA